MKLHVFLASLVAIISIFIATTRVNAADSNVIVTGNTSTWFFNPDATNATPIEFNMDQASRGLGSLYVLPIGNVGAKKFIGINRIDMPVSELNSISYDFMIGAGGEEADKSHFYLNVYANIDNSTNFYDCRFDYVPSVGSTTDFTTVMFAATATPTNVTKRGTRIPACPTTLAGMPAGSYVSMYAINMGDTSLNDQGLDGYFDNVVVDADSGIATYDFEPATTPVSADECKGEGWMAFNTPFFKNQGDCVSYVQSNARATGNKTK